MKIGLVCPYSITKGGGVLEIVLAMQAELNKRGHDAYVVTPRPRDAVDFHPEPEQKIILIGQSTDFNSPLATTVQISAASDDAIDEMLEHEKFDILHFHEPWVPMLSRQILARSKVVNVATFHAKLPESMTVRTLMRTVTPYTKSVLRYINEFTAPSEAAAEYICSLTDQPVALIPNGIDLKKYKIPRTRTDDTPQKTIFYVGRLEQRKGVKYLIKAYQRLRMAHSDVSLVLAGNGPDRQKLESLVEDAEIPGVTFLGYVTDEEKIANLKAADLFCSPALYGESFGVVLLEAMASGVVTVAGNNPGYSSVMTGVGSLSLIDPKDTGEFTRRLELLLYEKELRELWRSWAKEQLKQYGYPRIVDQYEEIYNQALEQHA
jgi:phosphatidylinositol alpha-mannosyltransferase